MKKLFETVYAEPIGLVLFESLDAMLYFFKGIQTWLIGICHTHGLFPS